MLSIHPKGFKYIAASLLVIFALRSISITHPTRRRLEEHSLQKSTHRGFGTHYVTLHVGKPAQAVRLVVSTGDDLTALPCIGCSGTDDLKEKPYNFNLFGGNLHSCPTECVFPTSVCRDGVTDGTGQCFIEVNHDPSNGIIGGYNGIEITDHAYIDTGHSELLKHTVAATDGFPLDFVCQTEVKNDITTDAYATSGVLSMSSAPTSFIQQMYKAGKIKERMFSLCFRSFQSFQPNGVSAGQVTLGGYDGSQLDTPVVWAKNTANVQHLSSYAVHIRRIYMGLGGGDVALERASQGTMSILPIEMKVVPIDAEEAQWSSQNVNYPYLNGEHGVVQIQTNTPKTCLHKSIGPAFKRAFNSMTGIPYRAEMKMSREQFEMLPTVFLQLEGHTKPQDGIIADPPGFFGRHDRKNLFDVLLAIPPSHYLVYNGESATATIAFGEVPFIGSNVLQQHHIVFDLELDRIGVAERRDCPEGISLLEPTLSSVSKAKSVGLRKVSILQPGDVFTFKPNAIRPDLNPLQTETTGLQGEIDDSERDHNGPRKKVNKEGRMFSGSNVPKEDASPIVDMNAGGDGDNDDHSGLESKPPIEKYSMISPGLPKADNGHYAATPRIGRGAALAQEKTNAFHDDGGDKWTLIGLAFVCLGFFVTSAVTYERRNSPGRTRLDLTNDPPTHSEFRSATFDWHEGKMMYFRSILGNQNSPTRNYGFDRFPFFRRTFGPSWPSDASTQSTAKMSVTTASVSLVKVNFGQDESSVFGEHESASSRSFRTRMLGEISSVGTIEDQLSHKAPSLYNLMGSNLLRGRAGDVVSSAPRSGGNLQEIAGNMPAVKQQSYYKVVGSGLTSSKSWYSSSSIYSSQPTEQSYSNPSAHETERSIAGEAQNYYEEYFQYNDPPPAAKPAYYSEYDHDTHQDDTASFASKSKFSGQYDSSSEHSSQQYDTQSRTSKPLFSGLNDSSTEDSSQLYASMPFVTEPTFTGRNYPSDLSLQHSKPEKKVDFNESFAFSDDDADEVHMGSSQVDDTYYATGEVHRGSSQVDETYYATGDNDPFQNSEYSEGVSFYDDTLTDFHGSMLSHDNLPSIQDYDDEDDDYL